MKTKDNYQFKRSKKGTKRTSRKILKQILK